VRLLRRNLLATYGAHAASIASGLALTPIIVHELGKEQYGLWVFIGSLTVFLGLLDVGVGPAVVRFAAFEHGRGRDVNGVASAALGVYGVLLVVAGTIAVALAWLVPHLLDVSADLVWPARAATLLVAGGIVLRFPLGLAQSLLASRQRFDVTNLGIVISIALYTALVAGVLRGRGGVVLLAGLALAAAGLRFLVPLLWIPREFPGLRLSRRLVTRERMRELLTFSWYGFLIQIAAKIVSSADVIVVGVILGPAAAALYGIPSRLFGLALSAGTAWTNVLFPAFSELEGREDLPRQRELLIAALRVGMAVMLVFALPLVLVPDLIIHAWIGPDFEDSTWVLALLGLSLVVHQPANVLAQYLIARARQRSLAFISLGVVSVNLALSIALAFAVGIWGVALATLIALAVETTLFVPPLVRGAGGPGLVELARASLRPVLPAMAAAGVILGAGGRLLGPDDLLGVGLLGVVWVAVAGPAVWLLGLDAGERHDIRARLLPAQSPEDVPI
jgi:O-antigen/teichoic acid export membrane protein